MKLHEALSTGLEYGEPGQISFYRANNRMVFTYGEVLSDTWQVRLPDGHITAIYTIAEARRGLTPQAGCTQPTPDAYITSHTPTAQDLKWQAEYGPHLAFNRDNAGRITEVKCECGSEAIGGGMHSQWCPLALLAEGKKK
jgi:hypothetical protein